MDDLSYQAADATPADTAESAPAASMDAAEPAMEIPNVIEEQTVPGFEEAWAASADTAFDPADANSSPQSADATTPTTNATDVAAVPGPADQPALATTHRQSGESPEVLPSPEVEPITIELGHGPKPPEGWTPGGGPETRG
jgi:hypothetical protein